MVVEEPGRAQGRGQSAHRRHIQANGQDLVIERGRLFYAGGPLLDPGIDARAYRKILEDNVTAGINARGTLRAPEVTVWSDPTMSDSEALSYLLLGRPLEATNQQEGSMLANAATSLGIRGGNLLAKKLGAALGLQEASSVAAHVRRRRSWSASTSRASTQLRHRLFGAAARCAFAPDQRALHLGRRGGEPAARLYTIGEGAVRGRAEAMARDLPRTSPRTSARPKGGGRRGREQQGASRRTPQQAREQDTGGGKTGRKQAPVRRRLHASTTPRRRGPTPTTTPQR